MSSASRRFERLVRPELRPWLRRPDLRKVPRTLWPSSCARMRTAPEELWLSSTLQVQVYPWSAEWPDMRRLTVSSTSVDRVEPNGDIRWRDRLGWDVLQSAKAAVGLGAYDALELFPREGDVVDVANMRHLWVVRSPVPWAWGRRGGGA